MAPIHFVARSPRLPAREACTHPYANVLGHSNRFWGVVAARRSTATRAVGPDAAADVMQTLAQHAVLASTPIAGPCSLTSCGDVVHRSTLDPVLRGEAGGPSWQAFAILAVAGLYLFSSPGVLPAVYDLYFAAALQAQRQRAIQQSDLDLGKKIGSGAFGSVFRATLAPDREGDAPVDVIVKKAKEFGEAEVWMNERMARASPQVIAEYVTAFEETPSAENTNAGGARPLIADVQRRAAALLGAARAPAKAGAAANSDPVVWIVWRDEKGPTLWDLMQPKKNVGDFPYNLEPYLLGRELRLPRGAKRRQITLKLAARQMIEALRDCHATGIVHRDFKPQNTIVSASSRRLKLIDFGAAADLRLGINYVPNEYLLDPRYAPPQQYIMSRQTPRPPPKPVALLLAPVLWAMEAPDRFDMYSVGITLLQMAFPALRSDNSLIAFNRKLRKECGWDLNKWRASEALGMRNGQWPKDLDEGFEVLDANGGEGWDLVCKLVTFKPSDRLTAAAALAHPWLATATTPAGALAPAAALGAGSPAGTALRRALSRAGESVGSALSSVEEALPSELLQEAFTSSEKGGLTEAYLLREFGSGADRDAPAPPREGRQTIAWWQGRQQELKKKLGSRKVSATGQSTGAGAGSSTGNGAATPPGGRTPARGATPQGTGKVAVPRQRRP